jgi:outer membrane receptor protein involved in Fe transport
MRRAARPVPRVAALLLLLSVLTFVPGASPALAAPGSAHFAGRSLADALQELASKGLSLIYSSDVVREDMQVTCEPAAASPRLILDELLAAHGLAARPGPRGSLLIVPEAPQPEAAVGAVPAGAAADPPPLRRPRFRADDVIVRSGGDDGPAPQPDQGTPIGGADLRRDAMLGDDVNRALARQPGAAAGDESARLFVRGGEAGEFAYRLDGMSIHAPFHLRNLLSPSGIIDANAVAGAELSTGNFSAEFGNSLSGVVSLTSLTPSGSPRYALGSSTMSTRFLTTGRFDGVDGGWVVSARTWYPNMTTDFVAPMTEDFYPRFHDLFGKFERRVGEGTVISGDVLVSADDFNYSDAAAALQARFRSTSRYAWLDVKSAPTPRLLSETMMSSTSIDAARHGELGPGASAEGAIDDQRSFSALGIKQDWSFQASRHHLLRGGWSVEHGTAEYDMVRQPAPPGPLFGEVLPAPQSPMSLVLSPSGDGFGAYVADRYQVAPPLTLDLGLRWDRQSYAPGRQVSPRLNLLYALGRRSALRAGWGRYYQAEGLDELPVEEGVSRFAPAESAQHWMLGFEQSLGQGFSFRVEAYRKDMSNLRPRSENLFDPMTLFPEIAPDRVVIAPSRAAARGLEMSLRREPRHGFGFWASYALASVEDDIDGTWVPRSWDQRHTVNFGMDYRRNEAWDLTFAGLYHSGWPTTGVSAELVANPDGSQTIQPILGPRNAERLPDYLRLDLKVRRNFAVGQGRLSLFASVTNLTDRANVAGARGFAFTPRADGTVQVDRQDAFWLGQVPIFGLEWESGP